MELDVFEALASDVGAIDGFIGGDAVDLPEPRPPGAVDDGDVGFLFEEGAIDEGDVVVDGGGIDDVDDVADVLHVVGGAVDEDCVAQLAVRRHSRAGAAELNRTKQQVLVAQRRAAVYVYILFDFANYVTGLIVFVINYDLHNTERPKTPREPPMNAPRTRMSSPRERPAQTI